MSGPTEDEFQTWLHPSDMVEHFFQQGLGDDEAKARTIAMLSDGLLRAAAAKLVANGRDAGLALIPRKIWPAVARTNIWSTGRFHFNGPSSNGGQFSISGYDVRIDPQEQILPAPSTKSAGDPAPIPAPAKRAGRRAGKHGEPIARVTKRLLSCSTAELATYTADALASELIAEYRSLGLPPPHEDNARTDARGILRAVREEG